MLSPISLDRRFKWIQRITLIKTQYISAHAYNNHLKNLLNLLIWFNHNSDILLPTAEPNYFYSSPTTYPTTAGASTQRGNQFICKASKDALSFLFGFVL